MSVSLVHAIVTALQQHQPWLADKAGGAIMMQGVRELWEQIKEKLGRGTTENIERHPDDDGCWEVLRADLLAALERNAEFREKMRSLAQNLDISQNATGDNNTQVAVKDSRGVKISIR